MSDTPRTDEEVEIAKKFPATSHGLWVSAEFARELEREVAHLADVADIEIRERMKLERDIVNLRDLLGWCLSHDGECLGDWPAKREQVVRALKGKP